MVEFKYLGFMCDDAEAFFADKIIKEQRDGCAVVGSFIKLKDGKTCLPSKGDIFTKDENGDLTVKTVYDY